MHLTISHFGRTIRNSSPWPLVGLGVAGGLFSWLFAVSRWIPATSGLLTVFLGVVLYYYLRPRAGLLPLFCFHFLAGCALLFSAESGKVPDWLPASWLCLAFLPAALIHTSFLLPEILVETRSFRKMAAVFYVGSALLGFALLAARDRPDVFKGLAALTIVYNAGSYLFWLFRLLLTYRDSRFELDRVTSRFLLRAQWGAVLPWIAMFFLVGRGISSWNHAAPLALLFPLSVLAGFIPAKRHQKQLYIVQTEKRKSFGDLLSGLAHELNNPLNFVYSNLEPLGEAVKKLHGQIPKPNAEADALAQDLESMIHDMDEGIGRAKELIQNFRQFPERRVEAKQSLDLNRILDRSIDLLAHKWKDRIKLERRYDRLPSIHGLAGELGQVFTNILANACDATPDGGTVSVSTQKGPIGVKVTIRDTGQGIPKEELGRIFDPFYTTKSQGKGTGLGLAITLQIIKNHSGNIEVKSAVGKGSEFLVVLPYAT